MGLDSGDPSIERLIVATIATILTIVLSWRFLQVRTPPLQFPEGSPRKKNKNKIKLKQEHTGATVDHGFSNSCLSLPRNNDAHGVIGETLRDEDGDDNEDYTDAVDGPVNVSHANIKHVGHLKIPQELTESTVNDPSETCQYSGQSNIDANIEDENKENIILTSHETNASSGAYAQEINWACDNEYRNILKNKDYTDLLSDYAEASNGSVRNWSESDSDYEYEFRPKLATILEEQSDYTGSDVGSDVANYSDVASYASDVDSVVANVSGSFDLESISMLEEEDDDDDDEPSTITCNATTLFQIANDASFELYTSTSSNEFADLVPGNEMECTFVAETLNNCAVSLDANGNESHEGNTTKTEIEKQFAEKSQTPPLPEKTQALISCTEQVCINGSNIDFSTNNNHNNADSLIPSQLGVTTTFVERERTCGGSMEGFQDVCCTEINSKSMSSDTVSNQGLKRGFVHTVEEGMDLNTDKNDNGGVELSSDHMRKHERAPHLHELRPTLTNDSSEQIKTTQGGCDETEPSRTGGTESAQDGCSNRTELSLMKDCDIPADIPANPVINDKINYGHDISEKAMTSHGSVEREYDDSNQCISIPLLNDEALIDPINDVNNQPDPSLIFNHEGIKSLKTVNMINIGSTYQEIDERSDVYLQKEFIIDNQTLENKVNSASPQSNTDALCVKSGENDIKSEDFEINDKLTVDFDIEFGNANRDNISRGCETKPVRCDQDNRVSGPTDNALKTVDTVPKHQIQCSEERATVKESAEASDSISDIYPKGRYIGVCGHLTDIDIQCKELKEEIEHLHNIGDTENTHIVSTGTAESSTNGKFENIETTEKARENTENILDENKLKTVTIVDSVPDQNETDSNTQGDNCLEGLVEQQCAPDLDHEYSTQPTAQSGSENIRQTLGSKSKALLDEKSSDITFNLRSGDTICFRKKLCRENRLVEKENNITLNKSKADCVKESINILQDHEPEVHEYEGGIDNNNLLLLTQAPVNDNCSVVQTPSIAEHSNEHCILQSGKELVDLSTNFSTDFDGENNQETETLVVGSNVKNEHSDGVNSVQNMRDSLHTKPNDALEFEHATRSGDIEFSTKIETNFYEQDIAHKDESKSKHNTSNIEETLTHETSCTSSAYSTEGATEQPIDMIRNDTNQATIKRSDAINDANHTAQFDKDMPVQVRKKDRQVLYQNNATFNILASREPSISGQASNYGEQLNVREKETVSQFANQARHGYSDSKQVKERADYVPKQTHRHGGKYEVKHSHQRQSKQPFESEPQRKLNSQNSRQSYDRNRDLLPEEYYSKNEGNGEQYKSVIQNCDVHNPEGDFYDNGQIQNDNVGRARILNSDVDIIKGIDNLTEFSNLDDNSCTPKTVKAIATSKAVAREDIELNQHQTSRKVFSAVASSEAEGVNPFMAVARATAHAATLASANATSGVATTTGWTQRVNPKGLIKSPGVNPGEVDVTVVMSTSCTISNADNEELALESKDAIEAMSPCQTPLPSDGADESSRVSSTPPLENSESKHPPKHVETSVQTVRSYPIKSSGNTPSNRSGANIPSFYKDMHYRPGHIYFPQDKEAPTKLKSTRTIKNEDNFGHVVYLPKSRSTTPNSPTRSRSSALEDRSGSPDNRSTSPRNRRDLPDYRADSPLNRTISPLRSGSPLNRSRSGSPVRSYSPVRNTLPLRETVTKPGTIKNIQNDGQTTKFIDIDNPENNASRTDNELNHNLNDIPNNETVNSTDVKASDSASCSHIIDPKSDKSKANIPLWYKDSIYRQEMSDDSDGIGKYKIPTQTNDELNSKGAVKDDQYSTESLCKPKTYARQVQEPNIRQWYKDAHTRSPRLDTSDVALTEYMEDQNKPPRPPPPKVKIERSEHFDRSHTHNIGLANVSPPLPPRTYPTSQDRGVSLPNESFTLRKEMHATTLPERKVPEPIRRSKSDVEKLKDRIRKSRPKSLNVSGVEYEKEFDRIKGQSPGSSSIDFTQFGLNKSVSMENIHLSKQKRASPVTTPKSFFGDRKSKTSLIETNLDTGEETRTPLTRETNIDQFFKPPNHKASSMLTLSTTQKDAGLRDRSQSSKSETTTPLSDTAPMGHALRVSRSLQRLNVPDWYKDTSRNEQSMDGVFIKRRDSLASNDSISTYSTTPSPRVPYIKPTITPRRLTSPSFKSPASSRSSTPSFKDFELPSAKLRRRPSVELKPIETKTRNSYKAPVSILKKPKSPEETQIRPMVHDLDKNISSTFESETETFVTPPETPAKQMPSKQTWKSKLLDGLDNDMKSEREDSSPISKMKRSNDIWDFKKALESDTSIEFASSPWLTSDRHGSPLPSSDWPDSELEQSIQLEDKSLQQERLPSRYLGVDLFENVRPSSSAETGFPILKKVPENAKQNYLVELTDTRLESENDDLNPEDASLEEVLDGLLALPSSPSSTSLSLENTRNKSQGSENTSGDVRYFMSSGLMDSMTSLNTSLASTDLFNHSLNISIGSSQEFQIPNDYDSDEADEKTLVKCRYSKCGKAVELKEARKYYKTCHHCYTYYCSRQCRKNHWESHKKKCVFSRVTSLCKHIFKRIHEDGDILYHISRIARTGYLSQGRGFVTMSFENQNEGSDFLQLGVPGIKSIHYTCAKDLHSKNDNLKDDHERDLLEHAKHYNPESKFVLNISIKVDSDVPIKPTPKTEASVVQKCTKMSLSPAQIRPTHTKLKKQETLILTAVPGSPAMDVAEDRKAREVCFINIQRKLRQRGVSLRHHFPDVYNKLCSYVADNEHFSPITLYPYDIHTGRKFMCLIMPNSDPDMEWQEAKRLMDELDLSMEVVQAQT